MSRMVKQLHDRGLVEVSASKTDRRETVVALTEEGASYADSLIDELSRIEGECVKAVGREAVEQVSVPAVVGIALIIAGVVMVNLFGPSH